MMRFLVDINSIQLICIMIFKELIYSINIDLFYFEMKLCILHAIQIGFIVFLIMPIVTLPLWANAFTVSMIGTINLSSKQNLHHVKEQIHQEIDSNQLFCSNWIDENYFNLF